jgi:hypothetical protein
MEEGDHLIENVMSRKEKRDQEEEQRIQVLKEEARKRISNIYSQNIFPKEEVCGIIQPFKFIQSHNLPKVLKGINEKIDNMAKIKYDQEKSEKAKEELVKQKKAEIQDKLKNLFNKK